MLRTVGCLSLLLFCFNLSGSHIRAGEISAKRISDFTLTYEFTFYGYRDVEGVEFRNGTFDFGDGSSITGDFEYTKEYISEEIELVTFTLVHTYQAANSYMVSFKEDFRKKYKS